MTQRPPSENMPCFKGKTMYDDGCNECQYWIQDMECPPAKKEERK